MTEKAIQEGIQDLLQAMSQFADADVVINNWSILDQPTGNAPYVIIENAGAVTSRQDTVEPVTTWQIPITVVVRFVDWQTSLDSLRDTRQAILDAFNAVGTGRSAGGLEATDIGDIRNDGPIGYIYLTYNPVTNEPEGLPIWVTHRLICEAREY